MRPARSLALLSAAILMAAALAAPSGAQPRPDRGGRDLRPGANPGAVIAAEIGFARLAQEKGQWTAFAETSTEDAEMFVPQRVNARAWLKKRANPAVAVKWQPHEVWVSCDGTIGITRGAWQGEGAAAGVFTTVWQRQKKGDFRWLLDQGHAESAAPAAPDWIDGKVADCPRRGRGTESERSDKDDAPQVPLAGPVPDAPATPGIDSKDGRSRDGSLAWRSTVLADGARTFTAWAWKEGTMREVIRTAADAPRVSAAPPSQG